MTGGHSLFKNSATYVTKMDKAQSTEETREQERGQPFPTKRDHPERPPFSHQEKRDRLTQSSLQR